MILGQRRQFFASSKPKQVFHGRKQHAAVTEPTCQIARSGPVLSRTKVPRTGRRRESNEVARLMKRPATLLAGIAALLLATGTAHAKCCEYFRCGKILASFSVVKHDEKPSTGEWMFVDPPLNFNFRCLKGPDFKCWLNGKFCRWLSDDQWLKAYPGLSGTELGQ
jgi:hypothetical protein